MKHSTIVWSLLVVCAGALSAQQTNSSNQYQGTSNPPPDSTITEPVPVPQSAPKAKPSPEHLMTAPAPAPRPQAVPQAAPASPAMSSSDTADDGIVMLAPDTEKGPTLNKRVAVASSDPDGDIVHPGPLPPGVLDYGTLIRARLLDRVSTAYSEAGDKFRAQVASDVYGNGQVLIPVGSEIDGTVGHVSTGHFAGHGSMILHPQTVILPDGSRYHLYAQVYSTPGVNAHVNSEGKITPGSRLKKDGLEYGGGAGAGAVAGAMLGGPAGALAGSVVGAGAVTLHLLMDHPQATLKKGTFLEFSLTQQLNLAPETATAGTE
ncbi:MAG: hypothetical protein ACLGPM_01310 [Acidobacteriota bacterium]